MYCFSPFLYDEDNDGEDQKNNDRQQHSQSNRKNICCRVRN